MIKRSAWIEIYLDRIEHNFNVVRQTVGKDVKIMPIVKANAYGHGSLEVARTVISAGADMLGVATLKEALKIREVFHRIPILILGYTDSTFAFDVINSNITHMVSDYNNALAFDRVAREMNKKSKVHIKVDTGMGRMGFLDNEEEFEELIKIFSLENTEVTGIFTHFANAGQADRSLTKLQGDRFINVLEKLKARGIKLPMVHAANSAAIMRFKEYHFDMVRPGIMLYGSNPSELEEFNDFDLLESMSLKTVIARVKKLNSGEGVGYDSLYKLTTDEYIATLPLGYADGLRRKMSDDYRVLVNDEEHQIVGNLCMDQMMISLKDDSSYKVGDVVTFFGTSKKKFQSIEALAKGMNEINYELYTNLGLRLSKLYYYNGVLFDVL